ncbi:MAG: MarR family winged helix-turn-helix transcriptional regulator [Terricaulis sp.]
MTHLDFLRRVAADAPFALTVRQAIILLHLATHGEQQFKYLAPALGIGPGALTRNLDVLCAAGWTSRTRPNRNDQRFMIVALTVAGADFVSALVAEPEASVA